MAKLTNKQKAFVEIYLQSFNATKAARDTGTNPKTAYQVGYLELRKLEVQKAIAERMKEKAMASDEVLARISEQAKGSVAPFIRVNKDGNIEWDFSDSDAAAHMHLIKKVHTKRKVLLDGRGKNAIPWEHEWVEVELYSSQAALEILAKHHKLLADEVTGTLQLNILGLHEMLEKVYGKKGK
jgi:phage terminase small subunit